MSGPTPLRALPGGKAAPAEPQPAGLTSAAPEPPQGRKRGRPRGTARFTDRLTLRMSSGMREAIEHLAARRRDAGFSCDAGWVVRHALLRYLTSDQKSQTDRFSVKSDA